MPRGKVTIIPKGGGGSSSYTLKGEVVFAEVRQDDGGGAFVHVSNKHIQVIITIDGAEVFRQVWLKSTKPLEAKECCQA